MHEKIRHVYTILAAKSDGNSPFGRLQCIYLFIYLPSTDKSSPITGGEHKGLML
jgi:hypothetical protein